MNFKKIIASALSAAMLVSSVAITTFAADDDLKLETSKSEVVSGDSFTISLPINASAGVAASEVLLNYDGDAFTCEGVTTDFGTVIANTDANPVSLSITDMTALKKTGKLFIATFRVKSGDNGGDHEFSIKTDEPDHPFYVKGVDTTEVTGTTVAPVTVTVKAPEKLATPVVTIDETTKSASWGAVTNAADYNVVLKKGTEEIYNNNQKTTSVAFGTYVTETAEYTVEVKANQNGSMYTASLTGSDVHKFFVDPTISITEKDYVTGSNGFDVVITPNGNTFSKITAGGAELSAVNDYKVSGNVIHINDEYLKNLTTETTLTFDFGDSNVTNPTLTVRVAKAATGATLVLAEKELDAYFDGSGNDADTTANDGKVDGAIVVAAPTDPVTNFLGVQFTISNNADTGYDSVDYEIVPADGYALLYDDATGLYEINVKPVDGVRPALSEESAGKGIVIGKLVYKGGYGKGTINAENIKMTVEKSDNTYAELPVNTTFAFTYNIPEPSKKLTVNVNLGKHYTKVNNVKAYQNMKLRVYSARLGFIDFDLGTDAVGYDEKNGTLQTQGTVSNDGKSYTLSLTGLPGFDKYTVFVSGDGYRDAKVQFDLNEDTTVDFWSNANDSDIAQVTKKVSGIEKTASKNFLAGDIIMNGVIDLYDLSAVSSYYGKSGLKAGDKDFIQYDLNRDGKVDLDDISILLAGWAE